MKERGENGGVGGGGMGRKGGGERIRGEERWRMAASQVELWTEGWTKEWGGKDGGRVIEKKEGWMAKRAE